MQRSLLLQIHMGPVYAISPTKADGMEKSVNYGQVSAQMPAKSVTMVQIQSCAQSVLITPLEMSTVYVNATLTGLVNVVILTLVSVTKNV